MPKCGVSSCLLLFLYVPARTNSGESHSAHPFLFPQRGNPFLSQSERPPHKDQAVGRLEAAVWHPHQELDRAGKPYLAAALASVSQMWIISTHLHRDLHWYLTASSSQGIYRSWHHNHPQLPCQTVHPWKEKQTSFIHPACNGMGRGAAASSTHQETGATQRLAGFMVKAWNWEAPQTQRTVVTQTFQVLGFFYRCQRPAKCARHICRAESVGRESNWTRRGEGEMDTFWLDC